MSEVAEGPEIMVTTDVGSTRARASGNSSTTESSGTMHTWWSGTREIARRPSSGRPVRKIVPVSAQEAVELVTTAANESSVRTSKGSPSPTAGSTARRRASVSAGSQPESRPEGTT